MDVNKSTPKASRGMPKPARMEGQPTPSKPSGMPRAMKAKKINEIRPIGRPVWGLDGEDDAGEVIALNLHHNHRLPKPAGRY